ncbi:hypothetical protein GT755_19375 [Herbidospora sp. NEAU-GS84]|uniref:CATRA-Associated Small Protein domain-containing protein n=1 Tax=Herbidospora solisilvae TaxID=2696284 RepID=A0A7C9J3Q6_9ACTN|nr:CATRA system-associated protein [Herbidospora solisilvae]NAS23846.1 hypothetical protein [Herbidospora solisilvae]
MTDAHDDLLDLVTDIAQWRVTPGRRDTIGSTPVVPPPPPVRERLNQLVHALSGPKK